jgi:hypothetical protein
VGATRCAGSGGGRSGFATDENVLLIEDKEEVGHGDERSGRARWGTTTRRPPRRPPSGTGSTSGRRRGTGPSGRAARGRRSRSSGPWTARARSMSRYRLSDHCWTGGGTPSTSASLAQQDRVLAEAGIRPITRAYVNCQSACHRQAGATILSTVRILRLADQEAPSRRSTVR